MKMIHRYFVSLAAVLWAACSPIAPTNQIQTSIPTELRHETPTILDYPTELPATASSTQTLDSSQSCVGSGKNLPRDIEGEFVLSGAYSLYRPAIELHQSAPYILIPITGSKIEFSPTGGGDFSVSPDRKWLAYFTGQKVTSGQLTIIGNDGKLLKTYPGKGWWALVGWLGNSRLLISKFAKENPYSSIILDPFSGTKEELMPNYPDIYSLYPWMPHWNEYASIETVYNSDLSMVVYPKDPGKIVLWDIKAEKEITEITDYNSGSSAPLWLSNGKQFIIDISAIRDENNPYHEDLVLVNSDGQAKRLTHLSTMYKIADIKEFSESADGRYIAFWFRGTDSPPNSAWIYQLVIYDMQTEKTKLFCVNTIDDVYAPVWSPTGNQLLVAGFLDTIDNYGTLFINVESGLLAQVEKNSIPVGWMLTP
jgi:hypothetical protein